MTIRKGIGLAIGAMIAALALAAPAGADWYGNGRWHHDHRWHGWNDRYYGHYYRAPPVVYTTPYSYNYGYYAPPVYYSPAPAPGFSITIRP